MNFQRPRGTNDILPDKSEKWQFVKETARLLSGGYQYNEIHTPIFKHYEVTSRGVGDTMDIVSKEMYDLYDKGEHHVTLQPEGAAPIVCSLVEHKLLGPEYAKPLKTFYMGPMLRYEHLQKERLRQSRQIGVEASGSENPAANVESMVVALDFSKQLEITQVRLVISSLGDKDTHQACRQALIDYPLPFEAELSEDSKHRLHENPLRVLDSKDRRDQKFVADMPPILGYLNEPAQKYFDTVVSMLDTLAVPYEIDNSMVRGLGYYTHTIFEIMGDAPRMGAQATVCADGRYDNLVEELGGPSTPGFGFAMGIEQLLLTMEAEEAVIPAFNELDAYTVAFGDETNTGALKVVQVTQNFGFSADRDFISHKAKIQFKIADKVNAKLVLVVGEDELAGRTINVKTVASRKGKSFPLEEIYEHSDEIYGEVVLFE